MKSSKGNSSVVRSRPSILKKCADPVKTRLKSKFACSLCPFATMTGQDMKSHMLNHRKKITLGKTMPEDKQNTVHLSTVNSATVRLAFDSHTMQLTPVENITQASEGQELTTNANTLHNVTPRSETIFRCGVCKFGCGSAVDLVNHIESEKHVTSTVPKFRNLRNMPLLPPTGLIRCLRCDFTCESVRVLRAHMEQHGVYIISTPDTTTKRDHTGKFIKIKPKKKVERYHTESAAIIEKAHACGKNEHKITMAPQNKKYIIFQSTEICPTAEIQTPKYQEVYNEIHTVDWEGDKDVQRMEVENLQKVQENETQTFETLKTSDIQCSGAMAAKNPPTEKIQQVKAGASTRLSRPILPKPLRADILNSKGQNSCYVISPYSPTHDENVLVSDPEIPDTSSVPCLSLPSPSTDHESGSMSEHGSSLASHTEVPGSSLASHADEPGSSLALHTSEPGSSLASHTEVPGSSLALHTEVPGSSLALHTEVPGSSLASHTDEPGSSLESHTGEVGLPVIEVTSREYLLYLWKGPTQCAQCDISFPNMRSYAHHAIASHNNVTYGCTFCSLLCKTAKDVTTHLAQVHSFIDTAHILVEIPHERTRALIVILCSTCDQVFPDAQSMSEHNRNDHREIPNVQNTKEHDDKNYRQLLPKVEQMEEDNESDDEDMNTEQRNINRVPWKCPVCSTFCTEDVSLFLAHLTSEHKMQRFAVPNTKQAKFVVQRRKNVALGSKKIIKIESIESGDASNQGEITKSYITPANSDNDIQPMATLGADDERFSPIAEDSIKIEVDDSDEDFKIKIEDTCIESDEVDPQYEETSEISGSGLENSVHEIKVLADTSDLKLDELLLDYEMTKTSGKSGTESKFLLEYKDVLGNCVGCEFVEPTKDPFSDL